MSRFKFRNSIAENTFYNKYAQGHADTWPNLSVRLVDDVCGTQGGKLSPLMSKGDRAQLVQFITDMKFLPGGRYLYYAGRPLHYWNNCFLLKPEVDTREEWGAYANRAFSCLMVGGGIGGDYSVLRERGAALTRTGGQASGPVPLASATNEIGRNVMQGGSRRSAIYASLSWQHPDAAEFLVAKNWDQMQLGNATTADGKPYTHWHAKQDNFNHAAPFDMTNISLNWDDDWLAEEDRHLNPMFVANVEQAMRTGEPGFSFNFGEKSNETLRNAPVAADTWVLTSFGYRQVGELVGEPALLWTGKQWADAEFNLTQEMAPTVVIEATGQRRITAEPSHEFFVERWTGAGNRRRLKGVEKVAAADLKEGDILHVSLPDREEEDLDSTFYTYGFVFGDGSFHTRYLDRAEVTLCTEEKKACLPAMDPNNNGSFVSVTLEDSRGYTRAYLRDEWFAGKSKSEMPLLRRGELPSFLAGLFDADGSYDTTDKRVRLSSVRREFLEGVRRALEELGIVSHLNKGSKSGYGGQVSWTLVVAAGYITKFANLIPTQRLKVEPHSAYRRSDIKVESVTEGPRQDVFCCDVGVEEHSFCAEGVIISNCTEVTSEDDSDVCNLGSINIGAIETLEEFRAVVHLASKFLVCGTMRADMPYEKVRQVREKNRRLGLGLMGIHEWLLKRGQKYEVGEELKQWLQVYKGESERAANEHCDRFYLSRPAAYRAIAPTGTIGMIAGTTTGIEPLFAVAYKRRYLRNGTQWHYEYVVDSTADQLIRETGIDPNKIDTAYSLSHDYERRMKFQADIQDYVDMSISSTINLPSWGSEENNPDKVNEFAAALSKYAPRLRGFTAYPDGSRGGQPLVEVSYKEAMKHVGVVFEENDICSISGKGGSCGV